MDGLVDHAALQAFAASLLDKDCTHLANVERIDPLWSHLLAEAPSPPEPNRLPTSLRNFGLDVAISL